MTTDAAASLTGLACSLARQGRHAEAAEVVRRLPDEAFLTAGSMKMLAPGATFSYFTINATEPVMTAKISISLTQEHARMVNEAVASGDPFSAGRSKRPSTWWNLEELDSDRISRVDAPTAPA